MPFSYLSANSVDINEPIDNVWPSLREKDMAIELVGNQKFDNELYLTIQGKNVEEVISTQARRFVYEKRGEFGYETAGMEPVGGAYPVDLSKLIKGAKEEEAVCDTAEKMKAISTRRKDLAYRQQYRFKRGI